MLVTISGRTFYLSGLCTQTVISCTHNGFTRIHVWLLRIRDLYLYYGTSAVDWRRHNAIWALSRCWFFKISRFHLFNNFNFTLRAESHVQVFSAYQFALCTVFLYLSKYCRVIFQFLFRQLQKVFLSGYLSEISSYLRAFNLKKFKISLKSIQFPVKMPIFAASNK